MPKMKIKKGDTVKVIAGRDKGKTGTVLEVIQAENKVRVEGVNLFKRHLKPGRSQANPEGGIVERNGTIHASNVMLVDPASGNPTRVGYQVLEEKGPNGKPKKVRVGRGKAAGAQLDAR